MRQLSELEIEFVTGGEVASGSVTYTDDEWQALNNDSGTQYWGNTNIFDGMMGTNPNLAMFLPRMAIVDREWINQLTADTMKTSTNKFSGSVFGDVSLTVLTNSALPYIDGYINVSLNANILLGNALEEFSNWWDRAQWLGQWGESQIRLGFRENGVPIYGEQVRLLTEYGLRIIDLVVGPGPGVDPLAIWGTEVKVNGGVYDWSQQAKDRSIAQHGALIVGGINLVPPLAVGQTISFPTVVVRLYHQP